MMARWYPETVEVRFWRKVDRGPACWEWTASRNRKGYGWFKGSVKAEMAHRVAWALTNGTIPDGLNVLHRCDNPPCVRPDHLFLGTHEDNVRDQMTKGRHRTPSGDEHWTRRHPEWLPRGEAHWITRRRIGVN